MADNVIDNPLVVEPAPVVPELTPEERRHKMLENMNIHTVDDLNNYLGEIGNMIQHGISIVGVAERMKQFRDGPHRLTVINGIYVYHGGSFYVVSRSGLWSVRNDLERLSDEIGESQEKILGSRCAIDLMLDSCADHTVHEIGPGQILYAGIVWKQDANISLPMNEEKLVDFYKKRK